MTEGSQRHQDRDARKANALRRALAGDNRGNDVGMQRGCCGVEHLPAPVQPVALATPHAASGIYHRHRQFRVCRCQAAAARNHGDVCRDSRRELTGFEVSDQVQEAGGLP